MKQLILLVIFIIGSSIGVYSQSDISKLEKKLKSARGEDRYDILYLLSKSYLPVSAKKSIRYGKDALEMARKLKSKNKEANTLNLIGTVYFKQGKYRQAINNFEQEYDIRKALNQTTTSAKALYNIGSIYESWDKPSKAIDIYNEVLELSKKYKYPALTNQCYLSLIKLYSDGKNYKDGFLIIQEYLEFNGNSSKDGYKIAILETQFKEERKLKEEVEDKLDELDSNFSIIKDEREILIKDTLKKNLAIADLTIEAQLKEIAIQEERVKVRRQRQWLAAFAIFFIVISLLSFLLYRLYKGKKKANRLLLTQNTEILEKNEEIKAQSDELKIKNAEIEVSREEIKIQAEQLTEALSALTIQHKEIERKNKQIMDSINYASKIQRAMLPSETMIADNLAEFMLLFQPCNVVSGDFYWYRRFDNYHVWVAADCTGHGVPGAFMSMLGMSFLNDVVNKERSEKPGEILDLLRQKVKTSLNQTEKKRLASDGMDMSLCILDTNKNVLHFAGANNPLYLIRNKQLQIIKGDMQPISIFIKENEFTHHKIEVQKDDCIYIFSDGYTDQFGGLNGDKFKTARFKELLVAISDQPMAEQKAILEMILDEWMSDEYAQLDDILIFGVKM